MTIKNYHLTLRDVASHDAEYLETVFSLANGHFGVRANDPITGNPITGTLINGFYETSPITYGEAGIGYAQHHQTILNLPDLRHLTILTEHGHRFTKSRRTTANLDLTSGLLTEKYSLETMQGESIYLGVQSVIGQGQRNFWAVSYTITPGNYHGLLVVSKSIAVPAEAEELKSVDPRKSRIAGLPECESDFITQDLQRYHVKTRRTQESVTMYLGSLTPNCSLLRQSVDLGDGRPHVLEYEVYVGDVGEQNTIDPAATFLVNSWVALQKDSRDFWDDVWERSEVTVSGNDELNLAIHYNVFQLNQAAGRDGRTNIAAKGLSGSGYEGHYFWDTEMYMLPYFIYTNQPMARQLLFYRYQTLPQARMRARALGIDNGALFAWRTINGEEASPYFPAGTAQYHIDADIAYAVGRYFEITRDLDFIIQCGFEMVLETARFWENFGSWNQVDTASRFEFHTVTGPDEYTALVNNNYYTNRLAKHNFNLVVSLAHEILADDPDGLEPFGLTEADLDVFSNLADHVYLPYSRELRINEQDDSFLSKPRWPLSKSTPENFPLLLHYHPLTIYRYQVSKQADTLLADYLFPEDLSLDQLKREYRYYEGVTTHDSSLSRSIFSILAARMDDPEKAYRYFMDTARMDLVNLQKNTADGLHLANLGGSWLALVAGFSGFYVQDEVVHFNNHLPQEISELTYRMKIAESVLEISLTTTTTNVTVISGPIPTYGVSVNGEMISLEKVS
ncbi:glycoside hydrolase family 65 protein [Levilactobacillus tangyuanensis]|uniref:Glycoside hydrolase family 65 protein n=1 Tax=Levilactobacillus tangyuanensis TaxID=2486021 RepID=A0ABW1TKH2_9LACO|nr:glycosyl hydrolase family 65 protein [Levilactobacillus tangyuanensis]